MKTDACLYETKRTKFKHVRVDVVVQNSTLSDSKHKLYATCHEHKLFSTEKLEVCQNLADV